MKCRGGSGRTVVQPVLFPGGVLNSRPRLHGCHLPLQEVDIFDNKLEFSEIKIAIGQGFLVVQLQSSFKVT